MSYGVYGHYELLSETVLAKGIILMSGVKINLNQNKTFYLALGSGYGFGDTYRGGDGKFKDYNRVVELGVRIG